MKVILLESVPKVGSVNEIVEVSDGFAMNSLIPQGLAQVASAKNIATIEKRVEENKKKDDTHKKEITTAIRALSGEVISIEASANEKGTLFSSLSAIDLSKHIKAQKNIDIEPSYIELDQVIKEVGTHKVTLSLDDVTAAVTVEVVAGK